MPSELENNKIVSPTSSFVRSICQISVSGASDGFASNWSFYIVEGNVFLFYSCDNFFFLLDPTRTHKLSINLAQ